MKSQVLALAALTVASGLASGGCAARKAMKQQAIVLAASVEDLDADLDRLEGALDTVHRLRRVRIEGDHLAADRAARETAISVGTWRLGTDDLSQTKLEVYQGVRQASDEAGAHAYGAVDYRLGVETPVPGYALDRAAIHRLVALLLRLAKPASFVGEAAFFVEYAVAVGDGAKGGVDEVVKMVNQHAAPKAAPAPGPDASASPTPANDVSSPEPSPDLAVPEDLSKSPDKDPPRSPRSPQ